MNVLVTRAAEGFPRRAFTVAEILRMVEAGIIAEDENFELIEGEVVPMSPKGNQHEVLKLALAAILTKKAPDHIRVAVETTVYLDDRTFVEPDICLYPKRLLPEDVRGRDLLLAIEVAGSSLGYDKGVKANLYARHGLGELWVISAATRAAWIHLEPQADGSWGDVDEKAAEADLPIAAIPGLVVRLADLD